MNEDASLITSDPQMIIQNWLNEDTAFDQESFETGGVTGIAIVDTDDTTKGTWQFSVDGTNFTNFAVTTGGGVNVSNALIMGGTSANEKIRFSPSTDFHGTATIKFRVWDGSQGTATNSTTPSTFNITSVGGTTAFSEGVISKTITVRPVNDAPNVASGAFAASDSNIVERDEDAGAGSAITISNFAVPVS